MFLLNTNTRNQAGDFSHKNIYSHRYKINLLAVVDSNFQVVCITTFQVILQY